MKIILSIAFIFLFAFAVSAQKVEVSQEFINRATQAFDEVVALRAVVDAQKQQIEAQKKLDAINAEIIRKHEEKDAENAKLIALLEKKSRRKISIFFGLVSIRF
jgi:hypothetical protein